MTEMRDRVLFAASQLPNIEISIAALLLWLSRQPDVDANRLSVVAVSFGSFVAPLSLRAVEFLGLRPATTVFIHGGANIKAFVDRYVHENPGTNPGPWAVDTVDKSLDYVDPVQH